MARQDIAGLLTGISSQRPDPMGMGGNAAQQRLAFGAQRAEGMRRGLMGAMGKDPRSTAEQLQMAMAQLDLSDPNDLRKVAQLQQATGDLTGAAKTAAAIRELSVEGNTRTAIAEALVKLGDPDNAQRVMDKTLPLAQGQQIVMALERDARDLEAKRLKAEAELPATIKTQRRLLQGQGVPDDHPIYAEVEAGDYGESTTTEFNTIAKSLVPDPNVTRDSSTKYVLPSGVTVWAAETKIGKQPKQLMYPSGVNADGSTKYTALPTDAKKYTDETKAGVTITRQDSEDARFQLLNAGNRAGYDNSAFNNLTPYEQEQLIDDVAARTNEIVKKDGLNEPEARKQAVQELYINRIEETPKEERSILKGDIYRLKPAPESKGGLDPEETAAGVAAGTQQPLGEGEVVEGTIIADRQGNRKILRNGQWVSL